VREEIWKVVVAGGGEGGPGEERGDLERLHGRALGDGDD
jgi:hypothetical protein